MRVEGANKLVKQLKAVPEKSRVELKHTIWRNLELGARVANTLAPDVTGETRGNIHYELGRDGLSGQVIGIRSDAPQQDKDRAYSVEYGRKKGKRGTTSGYRFMWQTRVYLAKRFKNSVRRAVKKALRGAKNGG